MVVPMKRGQKYQLFFMIMLAMLLPMTFNSSAASVLRTSRGVVSIADLSIAPIERHDAKNNFLHATSSTFSVTSDGWYLLSVEMNVSSQVSTTTSYDLLLDGEIVQSIIFNAVNTKVRTMVAAYLTADVNHELTISSSEVSIVSVEATQAPTIQGSTLSIFTQYINFLSVNTTLSFVFFVETSADVKYEWSSLGALTVLEAKLDGTAISIESSQGSFRNLTPNVPHNLTFKISGAESLLGPSGFTLTLKTLDETPPQLSNFSHGKGPIVDNKLFNVTITFNLEDDISGVLVSSVVVKYLTHDSSTDSWDNTNRTAELVSVSNNNVTFQFLIPSLKVTVDKLIVYISARDHELNKMEVEQLVTLGTSATVTSQPTPGFDMVVVTLVIVSLGTTVVFFNKKRRH